MCYVFGTLAAIRSPSCAGELSNHLTQDPARGYDYLSGECLPTAVGLISPRGVASDSRPERNSAKRPQLASMTSSPESFRSRRTRAVKAISLKVLENPRNPELLGGESWI
jgi:hypothetical protein